jgi:hypothetical protein
MNLDFLLFATVIKSNKMTQITNLERQINAIERSIKDGKAKNVFAAKNKVINLKAQLVATRRAGYWSDYLSR